MKENYKMNQDTLFIVLVVAFCLGCLNAMLLNRGV